LDYCYNVAGITGCPRVLRPATRTEVLAEWLRSGSTW